MRRIKVDQQFHSSVLAFNKALFKTRRTDFVDPITGLTALSKIRGKKKKFGIENSIAITYIQKIIINYDNILAADEDEMQQWILDFRTVIHEDKIPEKFWKAVVKAMKYGALRDKEMLQFLQKSNIKTCVYCHSQLTLIINKTKTSLKGLLQLDHKFPKSKYPFLCTSFYNLYPICSNCNMSKSDDQTDFNLYCKDDQLDLLTFGVNSSSLLKYEKTRNIDDIVITVSHLNKTINLEEYDKMFNIKNVYNAQKDLVQELIEKKQVYNNPYNKTLVDNFNKLFTDQSMIKRLIIGNYDKPEDMLKRPLSKFTQEIARDLKLIK
ncbi:MULTISPECIES: hypothetical protein [Sphingobacterium]|uniref:hypothetical protein n=1 Tax=Sphingobacterium TaxID=28453 RepID=UPI001043A8FF|nr:MULTISPECIES: hypothetical protein [Sphingobacterium]MCW2261703.1 hypothetical protein [Sphingobacterium kitahiroshimense]TCR10014.1 hypothetical protein EDF67_105284 [Sphingobacterium sp. JUb78]